MNFQFLGQILDLKRGFSATKDDQRTAEVINPKIFFPQSLLVPPVFHSIAMNSWSFFLSVNIHLPPPLIYEVSYELNSSIWRIYSADGALDIFPFRFFRAARIVSEKPPILDYGCRMMSEYHRVRK